MMGHLKETGMTREELFEQAWELWGSEPDHPFAENPEVSVLRHEGQGKWFGVVMPVRLSKLGLRGQEEEADVLNIKCQPPLVTLLQQREGVFPAYHMNRRHWVSIRLDAVTPDSELPPEELVELLDLSRRLTAPKRPRRQSEQGEAPPSKVSAGKKSRKAKPSHMENEDGEDLDWDREWALAVRRRESGIL
jgi:predicted DNA-binding protein (MmcQ/YjbR family)